MRFALVLSIPALLAFLPVQGALPQTGSVLPPAAPNALIVPNPQKMLSVFDLLESYGALTDQTFLYTERCGERLSESLIPMPSGFEIPAHAVHAVVGDVLIRHGFAMSQLRSADPRVMGIYDVWNGDLRSISERSRFVQANDLVGYADHPALLVSTLFECKSLDPRQTVNTLRSTIGNSSMIASVGNSSIMIASHALNVLDTIELLKVADAAEGEWLSRQPAPEPK